MAAGLPAKLTITGVVGPAQTVTAAVLNNLVSFLTIDCVNNTVTVVRTDTSVQQTYDISARSTFSWTVASNTYTFSIS